MSEFSKSEAPWSSELFESGTSPSSSVSSSENDNENDNENKKSLQ